MCKHDTLYRINNEKAGGAGCPLCAAERRKAAQQTVYDAASHAATVAARYDDAANPDPQYVSLPQLMSTATPYNDWQTFIAACNDIDVYGMMGDTD